MAKTLFFALDGTALPPSDTTAASWRMTAAWSDLALHGGGDGGALLHASVAFAPAAPRARPSSVKTTAVSRPL